MLKKEPGLPRTIEKSFAFIPTAGMRSAPEELILELYREIFYDPFSGNGKTVPLNPSHFAGSPEQELVVYALRGRRKEKSQSKREDYFAPAYPVLAETAWLRKSADRVIRDFLFAGPIAQYFSLKNNPKEEIYKFSEACVRALIGHNSPGATGSHCDVLAMAAYPPGFAGYSPEDIQRFIARIEGMIEGSKTVFDAKAFAGAKDEISETIYYDFCAILKLEKYIPRLSWLQILMAYLRFALPSFLLSQMRITIMLRNWVTSKEIASDDRNVLSSILGRNKDLFIVSSTPSRLVEAQVSKYMKARVELSLLVSKIEDPFLKGGVDYKYLNVSQKGAERITVMSLLELFAKNKDKFKDFNLSRESEGYKAWISPTTIGQGKNFNEFLRVLRRAKQGDTIGSYLLTSHANTDAFTVFPGPLLISVIVFLANENLKRCGGGKLLLSDLELHFAKYGVNFSNSANSRDELIQALQNIGVLYGSPDAGDSVEVISPYRVNTHE